MSRSIVEMIHRRSLEGNGISSSRLTNDQLYDAMIAIAEKRLDKAGLAAVFRSNLAQ